MNKTILIPAGEVQSSLALRVSSRLTFNALGNQILERYFDLIRSRVPIIRRTFNESELKAIFDAGNGVSWEPIAVGIQSLPLNMEAAIEFDDLAAKWQIDGPALIAKLKSIDDLTTLALIDFVEFAWSHCEDLAFTQPFDILARLINRQ